MNKKYLIIFLLFFITLLLTGYIYCDYKEKQITKNNDNVTKEETKKENDISEEKGKDFAAEKVVLKGEENVKKVVKKTVIIHSREACQDTLACMRAEHAEQIGGVIHCYSYSKEAAQEFLKMGFYFGFGGFVRI